MDKKRQVEGGRMEGRRLMDGMTRMNDRNHTLEIMNHPHHGVERILVRSTYISLCVVWLRVPLFPIYVVFIYLLIYLNIYFEHSSTYYVQSTYIYVCTRVSWSIGTKRSECGCFSIVFNPPYLWFEGRALFEFTTLALIEGPGGLQPPTPPQPLYFSHHHLVKKNDGTCTNIGGQTVSWSGTWANTPA